MPSPRRAEHTGGIPAERPSFGAPLYLYLVVVGGRAWSHGWAEYNEKGGCGWHRSICQGDRVKQRATGAKEVDNSHSIASELD